MNHIEIHQDEIINVLCDEPNWKTHGLDPNKSLLLYGITGVGKTYALDAYLKNLSKNPGHRIDAEKIELGVSLHGASYFEKFMYDNMVWNDFGQEEKTMMFMGTTVKPGQSIIMHRYQVSPRLTTHFTTNLLPEKMEEKYGDRVISRLLEMCNFIAVYGKDRRKLK